MSEALTLDGGQPGQAQRFDGEILETILPRAFAPGAPVALTMLGGRSLHAKSIGSRRRDDGSFDVRLRLISLRREDREALFRALQG